jgi:predicted nucleic acid-binding protein
LGVVFDCNILLQAIARKTGPAAACLRLAEEGLVQLLLSEEIFDRGFPGIEASHDPSTISRVNR